MGIGAREKRALVLAQTRAKAMLKKRSVSDKERKDYKRSPGCLFPALTRKATRKAA